MKGISSIGGAASVRPESGEARERVRDRLFARADTDGSGGIDKAELHVALEKVARRTGHDGPSAAAVMKRRDADGDGSLSQAELQARSPRPRSEPAPVPTPMPAPASTVDFVQRSASVDGSASA